MKRRDFLKGSAALAAGCTAWPLRPSFGYGAAGPCYKKVLVLGLDGMDFHLTTRFLRRGLLPNFSRIVTKGAMCRVRSSIPPQSPTAWANFIVGAATSVHGIYDFIHRDPQTLAPYLSTSRVLPAQRTLEIGDWTVPLSAGTAENLRKGKAFWDYLSAKDIPATIFKIPSNFPCKNDTIKMISGMGTPDLRGGYGNYTLFTTAPHQFKHKLTGGRLISVAFENEALTTQLPGPVNSLHKGKHETQIPIRIWRDSEHPVVRVLIQDHELILQETEWSEWLPISFPMLGPLYSVEGIIKLYVKSVHPEFSMYVSPINISPRSPMLPVVSSEAYGRELVNNVGYFYTQGFPEDTKALSEGILVEDEYLELAYQVVRERKRLLSYELENFVREKNGLLFFYFSSLDLDTHMYYRAIDPKNPLYNDQLGEKYGTVLQKLYIEMDNILGEVLNQFDPDDPRNLLMIMSDHGFAPFRRQVHLNNWLFENHFLALKNPVDLENEGYLENVDWTRTAAYNVGINSIYLNLEGRERTGVVSSSEAAHLRQRLRNQLLKLIDPDSGQRAVSQIWIVPYAERQRNASAPDLIVGWNAGYRNSWSSILGGFSKDVISDNLDKWSGDHCIDPALVPATLIINRKPRKWDASLCDLTATVLAEFGIPPSEQMVGQSIFRS